ncbi:MAG: hypothetical protein GY842_26030 [bacterium]|nr:hypothetical protein [bacterium]
MGIDGFMDLASAIKLIHENPLTISLKGRERLITRVIHNISNFAKRLERVIVIDYDVVESFSAPYFSRSPFQKVEIETGALVYVYSQRKDLSGAALKAVGRAIGFIFRLLVHAPSLIEKLLDKESDPWFESLLMSALIHTDPLTKRYSTKRLLTVEGQRILDNLKFRPTLTDGLA